MYSARLQDAYSTAKTELHVHLKLDLDWPICVHGINLIILHIVWFRQIYLSVFGTETIIYNNRSIAILNTFQLIHFVQKMRKYPSDVSVSKNCIDENLEIVKRWDPDNFPHFLPQEWCTWTIPEIVLNLYRIVMPLSRQVILWRLWHTVKPVLSSHLKLDKTKILMENGSLMKVRSIAECITFELHLAIIGIENQFLVFFLSGHSRHVLLYAENE